MAVRHFSVMTSLFVHRLACANFRTFEIGGVANEEKSELRHGAFRGGFPIGLPRDLPFLFVFSVQLAARYHTNPPGPSLGKQLSINPLSD